jgi:vacuolar protein-sorting-associated protein 4
MDSELTPEQVNEICKLTEGFSGADINILCREAAMVPLNDIQRAEYFVEWEGKLFPCNSDQPAARPMSVLTMSDVELGKLAQQKLNFNHFQVALQKTRPSVAQSDLKRFEDWTAKFGQEGSYYYSKC